MKITFTSIATSIVALCCSMLVHGQENALNFDGVDDQVNCGNGALDITGTALTVESWVKLDVLTAAPYQSTIAAKTLATGGGYILRAGGTNAQVQFAIGYAPSIFHTFTSPANVISVDTWHHIAATYDGAFVRLYVDGVEVHSQIETNAIGTSEPNALYLGNDNTYSPRNLPGSIDEVRIWNVTRSAADINTYKDQELCSTTGLVSYYRFNEGNADSDNLSTTTLPDTHGANDAALHGFALTGTSSNWVDGIAALSGASGGSGTDTQVACESYTWIDGIEYTADNNTATFTLTSSAGCDSLVTLDLTINNSTAGTDTQVACEAYTWIDGIEYTADNNTATHTLMNAAGCDSVVTLDLTINNSTTGTDTQVACEAYTWIDGLEYTADNNTATFTLMNAAGCDSVVTLDLTINNSSTGVDTQSACEAYTWIDGLEYTTDNNTATFTLMNDAGCDSVVTLDLTINSSTTGTDTQVACASFTWIDGIEYTADNNTATFTLMSDAGCDSVVTLDLTINSVLTGTDTQVACDTYTWIDGVEYTASNNTATFTVDSDAGCDSIVTLDLTINNSSTGTDTQIACDTYTWIDGVEYTASNTTATFTLMNDAGCDSVVTLDLTINNSSTGTDTQVACDTYTWIDGIEYTASNSTATHTLMNDAGCDSVVTLDLTINNSTTGTDTQVACVSYTWIDGIEYTADNNTATFTLTTESGCDSVVTLDLTINTEVLTGTDTQVACDTYTWIDGVEYTADNNTATFTLTSEAGCDSIVTLDLTINNSSTGTDTQVACEAYTWIDGVEYTADNTTATFTLMNAAGCDSVVTLDLTINNSTSGTDTQVACDTYTWIDGVEYTASNNTATFALTNAAGCDSIVTLDLTINTVNAGVTTDVLTITADATGATYQWVDCADSDMEIDGETGQSFTAIANGEYAVMVTENGCTTKSECVTIANVSIDENNQISNLNVYPNPAKEMTVLALGNTDLTQVSILGLDGKLVYSANLSGDTKYQISLAELNASVYVMIIKNNEQTSVVRLIKQ